MSSNNIFEGQITPRDITAYTLFRGVPDYSNLTQFNAFEGGYSMLVVLEIPTISIPPGEYVRKNETQRN